MPWQSSADQTEKKHTDIFSRAREGEAACERDTGIKNHTMVLEVVPRTTTIHSGVELKASADHAVAEFQRQKTVLKVNATRFCKLPDHGVREHLPRTKMAPEEERSFLQSNTIEAQENPSEIRQ